MMRLLTNAWHQLVCDGGLKRFQGNSLLSDIRMIHGVNESLSSIKKQRVGFDDKNCSHCQWPSKSQVEDAELKDYFMQVQLTSMGDKMKASASVKQEVDTEEDAPMDGLGWGMEGAMEEEEYHEESEQEPEEEVMEEVVEEAEDHDTWTAKDWQHVGSAGAKALAADAVVDVDKWDDEMKRMKGRWEQPKGVWKIKAPWASKPPSKSKAAWVRKTDRWGGQCWSDGWYRDREGTWWP